MPPLPKDCDYKRLIALLKRYEYEIVRQRGSHIRLHSDRYSHSITVPAHTPLKIGTLNSIITDVAARVGEKKKNLVEQL
jgi:predicted RNA binding protein YcfA (HicA-like mRNA interferase family)